MIQTGCKTHGIELPWTSLHDRGDVSLYKMSELKTIAEIEELRHGMVVFSMAWVLFPDMDWWTNPVNTTWDCSNNLESIRYLPFELMQDFVYQYFKWKLNNSVAVSFPSFNRTRYSSRSFWLSTPPLGNLESRRSFFLEVWGYWGVVTGKNPPTRISINHHQPQFGKFKRPMSWGL